MERKSIRLWSILLILLLVSSELFFVFSLKPASAEENPVLQFGQTVSGSISIRGKVDNYTFSGVVGDVVYLKLQKTAAYSYFYPTLQWCAPNGTVFYSRSDSSGFDVYEALPVSGQYTLMVYDENGYDTGSYSLFVQRMNSPQNTTGVEFGKLTSGSIGVQGKTDSYVFSGVVGDVVYLKLQKTAAYSYFYPTLQWCAPNGTVFYSRSDSSGFDVYEALPVSGQYTLMVYDENGYDTGSYSLFVQRTNQPVNTLLINIGTVSGSISNLGNVSSYSFSGHAGDLVDIKVSETVGGYFNPVIRVCASNGTELANQWGDSTAEVYVTLPSTGQYLVMVYDDNGYDTGSFNLQLKSVTSQPLILGQTYSGISSFGDGLSYSVQVGANKSLLLSLQTNSKIKGLTLYGSAGKIPSMTSYDVATSTLAVSGKYELLISPTKASWYYFVILENDEKASTGYSLTAALSDGHVTDVSPRQLAAVSNATTILSGVGFTSGMKVELHNSDRRVGAFSVTNQTSKSLMVNFNLNALLVGTYDMVVTWPTGYSETLLGVMVVGYQPSANVTVPQLSSGVPVTGKFVASDDAHYYRIDVPAGKNLLVKLDDADNIGVNELYMRFGSMPTRGTYDYKASVLGSADQQIAVPAAITGTWYVLAYGTSVPAISDFIIEADFYDLQVTGLSPIRYGQNSNAVLTINGMGFGSTCTAALVSSSGVGHRATDVSVDSYTQMTATFDLTNLQPATYTLKVSSPSLGSSNLTNVFEVLPAGQAKLETNLIVPSWMGYHATATIYVEYSNTGNVAMPAPLLVLTAKQNGLERAFLTLDSKILTQGFWTSAEPQGFTHSIQIYATGASPGILQPGETCRVPVYYAGWQQPWNFSYPPFNFNLGVLSADSKEPVDWASLKDSMKPTSISTGAWNALWPSFTAQAGSTWGDYIQMLSNNAAYLGRLGQSTVNVNQLLSFVFLQVNGLNPVSAPCNGVDAMASVPGLSLTFSRSFPNTIIGRNQFGPFGYGWSDNWQYSLQQATDGTITIIDPSGSSRVFQPDSRHSGQYFSEIGDHAVLTKLANGTVNLQEADGYLYSYSNDGQLKYVQDNNRNRITCSYTGNLLISLSHSSGQNLIFAYNAAGLVQSVTDAVGRKTTYGYDGVNQHLLSVQGYDGRLTTYSYSVGGPVCTEHALTLIINPDGSRYAMAYDSWGRVINRGFCCGAGVVSFAYSEGMIAVTDAIGNTSKMYFDNLGRQVKTENALGNSVSLTFDDNNNLIKVTDPTGYSYGYTYDGQGNLIRSIDPLGHVTSYSYAGTFNQLASVTDAKGKTTHYNYDSTGNLLSTTYSNGNVEYLGYDSTGEPTNWTNCRGDVVHYAYDTFGRITKKTYADGSSINYTYNSHGDLILAQDSTGVTAFTYDINDYITRIDYPGGQWLRYTYDVAGRITSCLDQTGYSLNYFYDRPGRLDNITSSNSQLVVRYSYDAAERLICKNLGNGVYTTYEYNAAGQLLALVNYNSNNSVLSRLGYTYDSLGRQITMNTYYGLWTYTYDNIGQLTHATLNSIDKNIPNQDLTYLYDALGNRIRTIQNGVATEYSTNSMNQYTQVGNTTYAFDLDGNLVQETTPTGIATYNYNDENLLVSVTKGSETWRYMYDAFGNRVSTTQNGAAINYVTDPLGNLIGQYDASDKLIVRYDYGLGLVSQINAAGNAAYYTFNAIGNVDQLTSELGNPLNTYLYDPFGVSLGKLEKVPNPFQFVGEYGVMKESNGLDFMRSRFNNGALGRFLSEDPLNSGGSSNAYTYVANNPVSRIDPSGLQPSGLPITILGGPGILGGPVIPIPPIAGQPPISGPGVHPGIEIPEGTRCKFSHIDRQKHQCVYKCQIGGEGEWVNVPHGSPDAYGLCPEPEDIGLPDENGDIVTKIAPPTPPTTPSTSGTGSTARSVDPNAKIGPVGYGSAGYVTSGGISAYRIDFENEISASAPAQQVIITDQLNSNLDWNSFELTEVGFGDHFIAVLPGVQHYETTVPISYNGLNFEVQVLVNLDFATGKLIASFYSIDPNTGLPPAINIGFLPPEDGTGRGMAHISYIIQPKANLHTGTQIRNVALISFDNQPVIATNQVDPRDASKGTDPAKECLNTIDAGTPTSQVNALQASITSTSFTVSWSGSDDSGGSGIDNYYIYVSENNQNYTLWQNQVTSTSGTFTGQVGKTYSFYSVATDNVGHVEAAPLAADTSTTLKTSTPPPTTQPTTSPTTTPAPTAKPTPTPSPTTSPAPTPNPTQTATPNPTVAPPALNFVYVALLAVALVVGLAFASLVLLKKVKLRK
jgi:RHS repeat-associated protein